jgi:hypothetical protein
MCCWIVGIASYADAGWTSIENDADVWSLDGPYDIPREYERASPSGTATTLFAGNSMAATLEGTRVAVFGQGGPYSCGRASVTINGEEAAAAIDWPSTVAD